MLNILQRVQWTQSTRDDSAQDAECESLLRNNEGPLVWSRRELVGALTMTGTGRKTSKEKTRTVYLRSREIKRDRQTEIYEE